MAASTKTTVISDPAFAVQLSDGNLALDFGGVVAATTIQIRAISSLTIIINGTITIESSSLRLSVDTGGITEVTVATASASPVSVSYQLVE